MKNRILELEVEKQLVDEKLTRDHICDGQKKTEQ
jgi:hypothetical protein